MVFDPVSIVGYTGTVAGLLGFAVSTVENIDKRIREFKNCRAHLQHYFHLTQSCQISYGRWMHTWCRGNDPYPEEYYMYFWGEEGFSGVCGRLGVVASSFSEIHGILSTGEASLIGSSTFKCHVAPPSSAEWDYWKKTASDLMSRGQDFNGLEPGLSTRICFALYKSSALKAAIDCLKSAVDELHEYSSYSFSHLQGEESLMKSVHGKLIEDTVFLKDQFDKWIRFMHDLHRLHCVNMTSGREWILALRAPDSLGSPRCLEQDSDIETRFIEERAVLTNYWGGSVISVMYPEDIEACRSDSGFQNILSRQGSQESTSQEVEDQPKYLVPLTKSVASYYVLAEISKARREAQSATKFERAEAALGLVNWVILLWDTPWIPVVCTCVVNFALYDDRGCHFTLNWNAKSHAPPLCLASKWKNRGYLQLAVTLSELALATPICAVGEVHIDDTSDIGRKARQDILRKVIRTTGSEDYKEAVKYCFDMDSKTSAQSFGPEQIRMLTKYVLDPVQQYYEGLVDTQKNQPSWLREYLLEYRHGLYQRASGVRGLSSRQVLKKTTAHTVTPTERNVPKEDITS